MDGCGRESKRYFAEVAGRWDDLRSGFFTEEMRDDAIGCSHLQPNAVVAAKLALEVRDGIFKAKGGRAS